MFNRSRDESRYGHFHLMDRRIALVSLLGIVGGAFGCVTAEIPRGEWRGDGVFYCDRWGKPGATPAGTQPGSAQPDARTRVHGTYPTWLKIADAELDGEKVLRIEILSERGEAGRLPDLGDKTHILGALRRLQPVNNAITLYQTVAFLFNPDPGDELKREVTPPPLDATLLRHRGGLVLQINYGDGFCDVFRFRGGQVEKTGSYFKPDEGLIHWTEKLRRVR